MRNPIFLIHEWPRQTPLVDSACITTRCTPRHHIHRPTLHGLRPAQAPSWLPQLGPPAGKNQCGPLGHSASTCKTGTCNRISHAWTPSQHEATRVYHRNPRGQGHCFIARQLCVFEKHLPSPRIFAEAHALVLATNFDLGQAPLHARTCTSKSWFQRQQLLGF